MNIDIIRRRTLQLLADALEYPQPGLVETVRECAALLAADNLAAAACLCEFGAFVEATPRGRLEELYTGAFDLNPAWYPYVGYHLFGESYKRSVFMLELNERYRAHGFPEGGLRSPEGRLRSAAAGELPDYLALLLRFLAMCDDAALCAEIVHEALLPALERMGAAAFPPPSNGRGKGEGGPVARMGAETAPLQDAVPAPSPRRGEGGVRGESEDHTGQRYYGLVLQALRLVLRQFPANTLPQEATPTRNSPLCLVEIKDSAKGPSAKPRYSLQRIKTVFGTIAKRKANDQRGKEQWYAGYRR